MTELVIERIVQEISVPLPEGEAFERVQAWGNRQQRRCRDKCNQR